MNDPITRLVCDDCSLLVANGPNDETPGAAMSRLPGVWARLFGCSTHSLDADSSWNPSTRPDPDTCDPDTCADNDWHAECGPNTVCPGCGQVPGAFADLWAVERVTGRVVVRASWTEPVADVVGAETGIVSLDDITPALLVDLRAARPGAGHDGWSILRATCQRLDETGSAQLGWCDLSLVVGQPAPPRWRVEAHHIQGHHRDHWRKSVELASLGELDLSVMQRLDCYIPGSTSKARTCQAIEELRTRGTAQIGWADLTTTPIHAGEHA